MIYGVWLNCFVFQLEEELDSRCGLCDDYAVFPVCTCQVCPRVYHRDCLATSNMYTKEELAIMDELLTSTGWTCYDCVSVFIGRTVLGADHLICRGWYGFLVGRGYFLKLSAEPRYFF